MTVSKGLRRTSRILAGTAGFWAATWPVLVVANFVVPDDLQVHGMSSDIEVLKQLSNAIPLNDRLLALACYAMPTALAVYALIALARLFGAFACGQVFSRATPAALHRIAMAIGLNVLASFVSQVPMSCFLTRDYPGHHGALGFGIADVVLLFAAVATYVVARVMTEARNLAEENASFV